jgi:hypothetical protein
MTNYFLTNIKENISYVVFHVINLKSLSVVSDYIALNFRIVSEKRILKNVEESIPI